MSDQLVIFEKLGDVLGNVFVYVAFEDCHVFTMLVSKPLTAYISTRLRSTIGCVIQPLLPMSWWLQFVPSPRMCSWFMEAWKQAELTCTIRIAKKRGGSTTTGSQFQAPFRPDLVIFVATPQIITPKTATRNDTGIGRTLPLPTISSNSNLGRRHKTSSAAAQQTCIFGNVLTVTSCED